MQTLTRITIHLVFRLARRLVETPLALVLGMMLMLLMITLFTWKSHPAEAIQVFAVILKYGIAIPLGLPPDADSVDLGTDQVFRLFAIWYTAYVVAAEVLEAGMKLFAGGRTLPDRRILLGILMTGYGVAGILLGVGTATNGGFSLWPLGIGVVFVSIGAASMALSYGLLLMERTLIKAAAESAEAAPIPAAADLGQPTKF